MSFHSQYAPLIWDRLYTVMVPDQVTLSAAYVKRFGTHVTGHKDFDKALSTSLTTVMIPVIKILEYYEDGVEVQITSRDDLIKIHKDIELYLTEWRDHLQYDLNVQVQPHKELILSLEKLSKHIYAKAQPREVIDRLIRPRTMGIVNPLQQAHYEQTLSTEKKDYEGIAKLIKRKSSPTGRF